MTLLASKGQPVSESACENITSSVNFLFREKASLSEWSEISFLRTEKIDLRTTIHVIKRRIILYIARNVVFYCVLVKSNNAIFSCQLLLLFCGRFERSGVQASCRAPNSIYQTRGPSHGCSGAGGLQFSVALPIRGNSTQSADTTFKKIFQNIVCKPGPLV